MNRSSRFARLALATTLVFAGASYTNSDAISASVPGNGTVMYRVSGGNTQQ